MTTTRKERQKMERSSQYLRKARRRWVRKIQAALEADQQLIFPLAQKAAERGLWYALPRKAGGYTRDGLRLVRISILCALYAIDKKTDAGRRAGFRSTMGWHTWCAAKGWSMPYGCPRAPLRVVNGEYSI